MQFVCQPKEVLDLATNFKHLSYEDRCCIEKELNSGSSINQISIMLNKNHSTILRKIKRHMTFLEANSWNGYKNPCKNRHSCYKKFCDFQKPCYEKEVCQILLRSPYVCNNCKSRSGCRKNRYTYYAKDASKIYEELKSNSRKGIDLTPEQVYEINKTISPLFKVKGQSINHIFINHSDLLTFTKQSFYNYVNLNVFDVKNIDLKRKVKYKKRKNNKRKTAAERTVRIGRTYNDFLPFIAHHPDYNIVEMDTVEGRKGGKCFLTLLWRKSNFMLIFLLEKQTMNCVEGVFEYLQQVLLEDDYNRLFQVILTDNGKEFLNPLATECNHSTGERITSLFYCDPGASWQKPQIEKNHEFIRYVLPKKTSFDHLTQYDCFLLSSHINSTCRENLNNYCPFKSMLFLCDEQVLNSLNNYYIEPDDVVLNKNLLK